MQNNQNSQMQSNTQRDMATIVMASLFIVVSVFSLWDTTHMLDSDSYVFPRAIAIAMIILCVALIVWNLINPQLKTDDAVSEASTMRRVLLVIVMLGSCLAMPWLGFLIPGIATFSLLMWIAMYEEWTTTKMIVYPLVAVVIVLGFYTLFGNLLQVPLPVGTLFE